MSMFRNLLIKAATAVKGPDTFVCKIKNTNSSAVTPYIAFPVRSAYAGIPSITVTIETSAGQSQTLTLTGTDLKTKNDTASYALGRIDYFSAVSMAQNETATVTIYSKTCKFPSFSFFSSTNGSSWGKVNAKLYEVDTPLPVFIDGYCGSIFCDSLLTSLPEDLFQYGGSIKTLERTFYYCTSLTSVPENLFSSMTKVTNLSYLFFSCTSLTTVPQGLFSGMTKVANLSGAFSWCTSLTTVPAGLFSGMTEVTTLQSLFYACKSLISIPTGLFSGMTKVTNLSDVFSGCSSLTTVPAGLFSGMTEVTSISEVFNQCYNLTSVPENLFSGMTKVTSVSILFRGCKSLTSIPAGLFDSMPNVTSAYATFGSCTSLTSIPANLFRNQTKATSFSSCFQSVPASAIHANIFCNESTEKTTRFADVTPNFSNCFASLTGTEAGTAPALWDYTYKATPTKTKCFNGNSATTLSNYSSIPSEWIS